MDSEWVQVRLRRGTLARLREWSGRVLAQIRAGRVDAYIHPHMGVTVDVAVAILLDRDERHQQRGRKRKPAV